MVDLVITGKKKTNKLVTKLKMGLSVASINAGGLTADPDKRSQLSAWMCAHSTDIMCLQEYYVRHKYSKIDFDMSKFMNYDLVLSETNTKTIILIKKEFQHEKIVDLKCNDDGIDCIWVAIFCHKYIIIVGSIYHSPDRKFDNIDINVISNQMNTIKDRYKNDKKKIIFHLNGDWNAKHNMWGSTQTDNRGMNLLNWMTKFNMVSVNDGSPTHRNKNTGKEDAIDLTITSMESRKNIVRWKVYKNLTDSYNFSDHYIMESLTLESKNFHVFHLTRSWMHRFFIDFS